MNSNKIILDELDRKIINSLIHDSSLSIAKIAEQITEPPTTVYNRINRLKKREIINRYTIDLDRSKLYGKIVAYILIQVNEVDQNSILDEISTKKNVENAAIITGDEDLIIQIRVHDIEELNEFILGFLRKIPGIRNSKSMIALNYYKNESYSK